jgi:hypothetical protein
MLRYSEGLALTWAIYVHSSAMPNPFLVPLLLPLCAGEL